MRKHKNVKMATMRKCRNGKMAAMKKKYQYGNENKKDKNRLLFLNRKHHIITLTKNKKV